MKTILLLFGLILCIIPSHSQNIIAVQHGTSASFYTNIDSAITYADNGDSIYLPGGIFILTV